MPTYEYRCPKGHVFEKFFPQMTNRRRLKCPTCGQLAERLISGSGLVFKGSGFYITDYKRAGASPAESESKAAESESKAEAKPEIKVDLKPESKSDTKRESKPKTPKKDK